MSKEENKQKEGRKEWWGGVGGYLVSALAAFAHVGAALVEAEAVAVPDPAHATPSHATPQCVYQMYHTNRKHQQK